MTEMRILTVRQPWAHAIIHGGKRVENRRRNIAGSYRGPIAVHAGLTRDDRGWVQSGAYLLTSTMGAGFPDALGAIIGVVDLVDVHHSFDCWERDQQRLARLYREDREAYASLPDSGSGGIVGRTRFCSPWAESDAYHLVLANPSPLREPISFRGGLGLRRLDEATATRVLEAVGD